MFAVPGWSIAAPLKTQTQTHTAPTSQPESQFSGSKKRKRDRPRTPTVSADNVAKLWAEHIEGRKPPKGRKDWSKKARREGKRGGKGAERDTAVERKDEASSHTAAEGGQAGGDGSAKKHPMASDKSARQSRKGIRKDAPQSKIAPAPAQATAPTAAQTAPAPPATIEPPPKPTLTPLQASMRAKLTSARFRHLNETLYTTDSAAARALFDASPDLFAEYHAGFAQQVAVWPENPVDGYVRAVLERGAVGRDGGVMGKGDRKGEKKSKRVKQGDVDGEQGVDAENAVAKDITASAPPLPSLPRTHKTCTIADLGCGTASLSRALQPHLSRLSLRVLSFDLHATDPALVTPADIAALPVKDGSVDVAVLCLALMGTNWLAFVDEAWRVLRWRGECWVAEIKSRFGRVGRGASGAVVGKKMGGVEGGVGAGKGRKKGRKGKAGDDEEEEDQALDNVVAEDSSAKAPETDVSAFVAVLQRRGFVLADGAGVDTSNKMFVKMVFVKAATPVRGKNVPVNQTGAGGGINGTWKAKGKGAARNVVDDEIDESEEAKVLKPCVYKQR